MDLEPKFKYTLVKVGIHIDESFKTGWCGWKDSYSQIMF